MSDAIARIIDANLNRAREALRVLEDVARFGLEDEELCGRLKGLRHGLREAASVLPVDRLGLVAARDTPGDVGTSVKIEGEMSRGGLREVAIANAARLTEALRSLEEAAKTLGREAAERFEQTRYRAYDVEQSLTLALGTGRESQWRLCVLVTESLCRHHSWERIAELAIDGGAECVQLREKGLDDGELLVRACRMVEIAKGRAAVIVNDRPDVALMAGANGVHVGPKDLPAARVREMVGGKLLIGVSCASVEDARAAARAGADYCGVGPMFATTTKEKPVREGPGLMSAYLAEGMLARVPHLAIGGIDAARAGELARLGVRGVAVSAAVCGAGAPAEVCRDILRALQPSH